MSFITASTLIIGVALEVFLAITILPGVFNPLPGQRRIEYIVGFLIFNVLDWGIVLLVNKLIGAI